MGKDTKTMKAAKAKPAKQAAATSAATTPATVPPMGTAAQPSAARVAKLLKAKVAKAKAPKAAKATKAAKSAKTTKAATPKVKAAKRLPLPKSLLPPAKGKAPKSVRLAESRHLRPLEEVSSGSDARVLDRLWATVQSRKAAGDVAMSHSARLLSRGMPKVAQKLGEEAVECVIEATLGNRTPTILESADVLYHLLVVWVGAGIRPEEVWAELARREGISGIVEKASRGQPGGVPAALKRVAGTSKLP